LTPIPPTATAAPGQISGRLLFNGAPANGVTLELEDQAFNTIAQTTAGADGSYNFSNLPASSQGYVVSFAQEWNDQYKIDQVISWGGLGPVAVANGVVVQLPDFDISLLGFGQTNPAPNAAFSAGAISGGNPITFEWSGYPQANAYWVDLAQEEGQAPLWTSQAESTSLVFNGKLSNGEQIQPGEYWWGIGAHCQLGQYNLVVYGYLPVLRIEP
jgi:hypothetical protein